VWEPDTLKCVATLTGHTGSVLSVAADRSFIYSGSQDKLLKVPHSLIDRITRTHRTRTTAHIAHANAGANTRCGTWRRFIKRVR
jgi:WD40 repeat protein